LERVVHGRTAKRLSARELRDTVLANQPIFDQLPRGLAVAYELAAAADRDDDLVGQLPPELLSGLERQRLGALRVEGPDIDVAESPGRRLDELAAEPVDLVI